MRTAIMGTRAGADFPPGRTSPSAPAEPLLAQLEAAHAEVCRIARERWEGGNGWRTSIPARPDYDSDLVIGAALRNAQTFVRAALSVSTSAPKDEVVGMIRREHENAVGANAMFSTEHWKHNAGREWPDADDGSYTAFKNCQHPACKWAREPLATVSAPKETSEPPRA